MTDKCIPMHKEIAMGIASKAEMNPKGPKIHNKKSGGVVAKKCGGSVTKRKK